MLASLHNQANWNRLDPTYSGITKKYYKMRKKIYTNLDDLQEDLDSWLHYYNHERPHSEKYCYGKTPIKTWEDSKTLVFEKNNQIAYLKRIPDKLDLTDKVKL